MNIFKRVENLIPQKCLREAGQILALISQPPWVAGSAQFPFIGTVIAKLCKSNGMAGAESEVPEQALLLWEEGRKNPNLQQVIPTLTAPRRLCFYFCLLLGRIFLPLSHQPLNSFPLRHPQNGTQGIIAHQWIAHRGLSPIRSSSTFCFHKALPTSPKSQWQMFPWYFFKGMKYRTRRNMKMLMESLVFSARLVLCSPARSYPWLSALNNIM